MTDYYQIDVDTEILFFFNTYELPSQVLISDKPTRVELVKCEELLLLLLLLRFWWKFQKLDCLNATPFAWLMKSQPRSNCIWAEICLDYTISRPRISTSAALFCWYSHCSMQFPDEILNSRINLIYRRDLWWKSPHSNRLTFDNEIDHAKV